jgi:hypothetical protein
MSEPTHVTIPMTLDLPLFLQQKATLAGIIELRRRLSLGTPQDTEHLEGILELLDHIQDTAEEQSAHSHA